MAAFALAVFHLIAGAIFGLWFLRVLREDDRGYYWLLVHKKIVAQIDLGGHADENGRAPRLRTGVTLS